MTVNGLWGSCDTAHESSEGGRGVVKSNIETRYLKYPRNYKNNQLGNLTQCCDR